MKRGLTVAIAGVAVGLVAAGGAAAPQQAALLQWFEAVRIVARPELPAWFVRYGPLSEAELRGKAAEALDLLYERSPETRKQALALLRDIVGTIPDASTASVLEWVRQTDPQQETVPANKTGDTRLAFTVREEAGRVLARLQERVDFESWLMRQPPATSARAIADVLSNRGPDWRHAAKPASDDMLTMWLVRHPAESLPVLPHVPAGTTFVTMNGPLPELLTTNRAAQAAAAIIIGVNRQRAGVPYLLRLLSDPNCFIQTAAQPPPPGGGATTLVENLERRYPLRDLAAGALQRLGFKVTFDGSRYQVAAGAQ